MRRPRRTSSCSARRTPASTASSTPRRSGRCSRNCPRGNASSSCSGSSGTRRRRRSRTGWAYRRCTSPGCSTGRCGDCTTSSSPDLSAPGGGCATARCSTCSRTPTTARASRSPPPWWSGTYASRGDYRDGLTQLGFVGLVEAIQRFDPGRNVEFVSFARPTILGELRRHFRDARRRVRPTRRIQELELRIREATDELHQESGRSRASRCSPSACPATRPSSTRHSPRTTRSARSPWTHRSTPATYLDMLGDDEPAFDDIVDSKSLRPLLEQLPERERTVMPLRFYGNKTQTEIADRIGVSQM
ncbi:MAG: sigma-70 family RNA polymerase sigma factor, partial [Streptosporangiales bacterium]|nr:sigma-70 family RNA polymerase sigma factor [Streptosporangiales bacterium]